MRQKRAQKREENMPNIKPISDLRNYSDVLHDVAVGAPVFLTKNGRGRYVILDTLPGTYRLAARQRYQIRQNSQSPGFIRLRRRTGLLDDGQ